MERDQRGHSGDTLTASRCGPRPPDTNAVADSTPNTDDDVTLLRRAAGDHDALAALYRRYVRRVSAFAARRCATADDVADVVAETFDRLLRSAHRYDPARGPVAAFVFAIAGSTVAEQHRQSPRRQALADRLQGRDLLDDDVAHIELLPRTAESLALLVPPVPGGYRRVDRLALDEVRAEGCVP